MGPPGMWSVCSRSFVTLLVRVHLAIANLTVCYRDVDQTGMSMAITHPVMQFFNSCKYSMTGA